MRINKKIFIIASLILLAIILVGCTNLPSETFMVSFDTGQGGEKTPLIVHSGEQVAQLESPTKDGYDFLGWSFDGNKISLPLLVESDKTLVAIWERLLTYFTVSFDTKLGSSKNPMTISAGEYISMLESPIKDGYDFVGWTLEGEKITLPLIVDRDKTLVAVYRKIIAYFIVTFVFDNDSENQVVEIASGDKLNRPDDPVASGYDFIGWFAYATIYDFDFEGTEINQPLTLYARWRCNLPFKVADWPTIDPDITFDFLSPVTINFWHNKSINQAILLERQVDDFHLLFPNITVNLRRAWGDSHAFSSQITVEIINDSFTTIPDVIAAPGGFINQFMPLYPRNLGIPMPLNNIITQHNYGFTQGEWLDFFPAFRRQVQFDNSAPFGHQLHDERYEISGTVLSLPWRRNTDVLIYNRTLLAEFGLTSMPTTWEETLILGTIINVLMGESSPLITGWEDCINVFATVAHQIGVPLFIEQTHQWQTVSDLINFNNFETITMLEFFNHMVQTNMLLTQSMSPAHFVSDTFELGNMLSFITRSNTVEVTARRSPNMVLGVAPILQMYESEMVHVARGTDLSLLYNGCTQRMIASWKLMKFLTSSDVQAQFIAAYNHPVYIPPQGFTPTRASVLKTDTFAIYRASIPFAGVHQSDLTYAQLASLTPEQRTQRLVFDTIMVTIEIIDTMVCALPLSIPFNFREFIDANIRIRFTQAINLETSDALIYYINQRLLWLRHGFVSIWGEPSS